MTVKSEGKELVITRVLNAPRELVFKAWSEVEHLKRWWDPLSKRLSGSTAFQMKRATLFGPHLAI
ncbi:hypothetical protein PAECIP111893_03664 [Paenibacillus plantiphilus]|uniref:Activator of Hsp90 ATPase homologue 1/2-like C-terminal domain-containing protein n=1 Tax=Paenibacillus plantiphilus TaxID=2905650 RepID=A0ABM9CGN2_9BACL|nr:SRPBCC domain-containing protein [Paenibacillus plantiphilus]CAH1213294.1 hypothetical protein PAECIP111893_03664 [Paenibacillus plantiphilus]